MSNTGRPFIPNFDEEMDWDDHSDDEATAQALTLHQPAPPAAAAATAGPRAAPVASAVPAVPRAAPAAPRAAPPAALPAAALPAAPPAAAAAGAGPAPAPAPAQRQGGDGSRRRDRNARGGEQPARGGERPARGGERPARGGERPARGGERHARGGERHARGGRDARGGERPVRGGERPARGSRDARGGERPARGGAPPPPPQGRPRQAPPRQAAPPQPQEEFRIKGLADPVAPPVLSPPSGPAARAICLPRDSPDDSVAGNTVILHINLINDTRPTTLILGVDRLIDLLIHLLDYTDRNTRGEGSPETVNVHLLTALLAALKPEDRLLTGHRATEENRETWLIPVGDRSSKGALRGRQRDRSLLRTMVRPTPLPRPIAPAEEGSSSVVQYGKQLLAPSEEQRRLEEDVIRIAKEGSRGMVQYGKQPSAVFEKQRRLKEDYIRMAKEGKEAIHEDGQGSQPFDPNHTLSRDDLRGRIDAMSHKLWPDYDEIDRFFGIQASFSGGHGVGGDAASIYASQDIDQIRSWALESLKKYFDETICEIADEVDKDFYTDDQLAALPSEMQAISSKVGSTLERFFSGIACIRNVYETALRNGHFPPGELCRRFRENVTSPHPDRSWLDFSTSALRRLQATVPSPFRFVPATAANTAASSSSSQALIPSGLR
ncbi:MAG: hypothetical protein Q9187_003190 [Circinaria calcarea]